MAVKLNAEKREDLKKSHTRTIRQQGLIPAVVYGKGKEPKTVAVNSIDLLKTVRDEGRNAIISLNVAGESVDVMLHDYQVEPIKDELLHADFYAVNMSQVIDVEVPIHLDGDAQGSKDGGVLQQPLYNLAIRAKPGNIPEEIVVDVSKLEVGDSITVSDLPESKDYEITEDESTTIVSILAPDSGTVEEDTDEEQKEPELVNGEANEE
ncbi:50S ribosomal protein L25/general stress protein Ctc [Sediminibacillus albus]|uniref:Large ribosomal subunit protein bL25 n=1 Tax=Sediminibacillus albus TaxID=407036 RepID=A0A1G9D8E2_9BACI|nr:50S ribosomal protein L25/general stress protein Ctc [Sediminibacillus albus]SDK60162.1 large subunit ribosomal protein L25 [Sediminibacillus albus]